MNIYKTIVNIYDHLQDQESKDIFRARSLYSLTGDVGYFMDYVSKSPARQYLENASNEKAYIFGCGVHGKRIFKMLNKDWCGFTDNDESLWGRYIDGVKIIPPQELPGDCTVYLAVKWYQEEIKEQLLAQGIKVNQIVNVGALLVDLGNRQYFDEVFLPHVEDEIFVDVGCLNGGTSKNFIKWTKNEYKHIYCFEADPYNAENCKNKMHDLISDGKMTLIKKAVAESNGFTSFMICQNGCSKIGEGSYQVEKISLDSVLINKSPTFIKMDIEGGEFQALKGARGIIEKYHPKLAVSVYHLPGDIFNIPALILSYYNDYKFYLRHYSPNAEETVLYAI